MTVVSPARRTKVTAAASVFALGLSIAVAPESLAQDAKNPVSVNHVAVGATPAEMNFSWRTKYKGQEFVKYYRTGKPGEARDIPATEADFGAISYRVNHGTITGLEPGTEYTYQLGSNTGGWSEPATFHTQPKGDNWNFLHFSDAQIGVNLKITEQANAWRAAVQTAMGNHPDTQLIVHSGDQVEGNGGVAAIVPAWEEFFSPEAAKKIPLALAKGNHELLTFPSEDKHFKEHVNFPNSEPGDANYFFERNNALFIVLDSNQTANALSTPKSADRKQAMEKQAQFVRDTTAAHGAGKDWTIVVMHHAAYSHGGRYHEREIADMRNALAPVFTETGVDLVLNGHDHMYNRSHLMNGTEPVIPEAKPEPGDVLRPKNNEVVYLTTTTAGGGKYYHFHSRTGKELKQYTHVDETYGQDFAIPEIAYWQQDYTPDYANIEVSKNQLKVSTFNVADNSLVDEFTIDRSEKPAPSGGTKPGNGGTKPGDGDTKPGDGGTKPGDGGNGTKPGDGGNGTKPGDGGNGTKPGDGGSSDNGDKDGSGDGSSLSTGGIIGIVVAGILALVAGVVALQPQIREIAKQFGINL